MVWGDPVSQDVSAVARLAERHGVPVIGGARALPGRHAAGLGMPTRSCGSAAPSPRPSSWAPPPWCCTRRFAGSVVTQRSSPTRWPALARSPGSRWPWRTCSRWRGAGCAPCPTSPASTPPRSATATTRWTSRTPRPPVSTRSPSSSGWARACAHVHLADGSGGPRDEHLVPGPRHPALRRGVAAAGGHGVRRRGGGRDQHPALPHALRPRHTARPVPALRPAAPAAHRGPRGGTTHGVIAAAWCHSGLDAKAGALR